MRVRERGTERESTWASAEVSVCAYIHAHMVCVCVFIHAHVCV